MKEVHAALLLHASGQKITEESLAKVLAAAGASEEPIRLKALVAALEGVKIDEAVKQAAIAPTPVAGAGAPAKGEEKKEEKHEPTEEEKEAEAAEGLASLFT